MPAESVPGYVHPSVSTYSYEGIASRQQMSTMVSKRDGTIILARGNHGHSSYSGHSSHPSSELHDSSGQFIRNEEGYGYGEGTGINENSVSILKPTGDGTGTYVNSDKRKVKYRAVNNSDRYECDANGDNKYDTKECSDMPLTKMAKLEDFVLNMLAYALIVVLVLGGIFLRDFIDRKILDWQTVRTEDN